MRPQRYVFNRLLAGAALLMSSLTASAHIGYSGRDFGTIVPDAAPVTISNQSVSGNFGWADGTDYDFGDSHKLLSFRFRLDEPAAVTISFSASTNGGEKHGGLNPGFSVYQGLAHLPPISDAPGGSPDYDTTPITQAYLASLGEGTKEGAFRALNDWRVGGENQKGPVFDFEAPDGLSTFVFKGYAVDGDATLFGPAEGVLGDGKADGTVKKTFYLPAGDYSIFVGGANYSAQDTTSYGLTGTISATTSSYVEVDPDNVGVPYRHQVTLGANQTIGFSRHVGAWSWEDSSLFDAENGEPPVGWTHESDWVALKIQEDTVLTLRMARDANVPWPSGGDEDRKADTSSMYPSLTLYRGWDNDGESGHTYNNRGNIGWAEDLQYLDHVDNSTEESITRSWFLKAGEYTLALGSKAPAVNANRQGFSIEFETQSLSPHDPAPGGIEYSYTIVAGSNETNSFSNHVGAWSWEDNSLFSPGQPSVGWTHTSNWVALKLTEEVFFSLTVERDAEVPWPTPGEPDRKADTSSMFPSFTLYRGWDNDGDSSHSYNNRGNVLWAEDIRYLDHVDNSTDTKVTRTWRLPAGEYTLAIGSNAPADNPLRQGYKATYHTLPAAGAITSDPAPGGIAYDHIISVGRGDQGALSNHVGAWSWEDSSLFDAGSGEEPVGWTHTSRWVALQVKESITLHLTMSRDANVPWPTSGEPKRKADTSSMFPSFTLYRGWDNDGDDFHSYQNRDDIDWAEDLSYLDHYANATQPEITRSYTLAPGNYTLALGSNAPATNDLRQGFRFAWSTSTPESVSPVITQQPKGQTLVTGKKATFSVKATGLGLTYQWFRDGVAIAAATSSVLTLDAVTAEDAGDYTVEVRNAAGWVTSTAVALSVISVPEVDFFDIPNLVVGQSLQLVLTASNDPTSFSVKGLPKGLKFDSKARTISGRPLVANNLVTVEVTASNKAGVSDKAVDTFSITGLASGIDGSFTGSIDRAPGINDWLGGSAKFQVTGVGSLTGTVTLGGKKHKVAALLDTSLEKPTAVVNLARSGQPALTLSLQVDGAAKVMTGQLSDGVTTLPFVARQPLAEVGAYAGDYTAALLLEEPDRGNDDLPQGASVASFQVTAKGAAKGVLLLADKTKLTFSAPLEQNGHLTVFSLLYKGAGSLLGTFAIEAPTTVDEVSVTSGNLAVSAFSWFKRAVTKSRVYQDGFGPLELQVVGRKYAAPAAGSLALDAEAGAGNVALTFSGAGLADDEARLNDVSIELKAKGVVKIANPNPGKVKLSVTPGTVGKFKAGSSGSFKGSFELSDSEDASVTPAKTVKRSASFQGMIVDDGENLKGYGFFLLPQMPSASPKTTLKTSPILSGSVLLEATAP